MDEGPRTVTVMPKAMPPHVPDRLLARPQLEVRLRDAMQRQVCVVVARAGFGKTTALAAALAATQQVAWYHVDASDRTLARFVSGLLDALRLKVPDLSRGPLAAAAGGLGPEADADERHRALSTAGAIAENLRDAGGTELLVVLDDLHELGSAPGPLALVEALCRQGAARFVLSSRTTLPFTFDRLRGQGRLAEIGAADLAFSAEEVADVLTSWCGESARQLAPRLHELTGGWPVGVRLASEAMARADPEERGGVLARLGSTSGTLQRYLLIEVVGEEDQSAQDLLQVLSALPEVSVELCAALGVRNPALHLEDFERRGLFLQPGSRAGWVRLATLVRETMEQQADHAAVRSIRRRALAWLEQHGPAPQAVAVAAMVDDGPALLRAIERHGAATLAAGRVDLVIDACTAVPDAERTPRVEQLHGEALQVVGRWEEALLRYEAAGAQGEQLPPGLAWRKGLIHYFRGALNEALEVFSRGLREGTAPVDEALLLAWESSARWRRGELELAEASAQEAFRLASAAGDDGAAAAAHTALAMVAAARGDRSSNDAHYLRALEHAERAADALQTIRIHTNRASFFLDEGAYEAAFTEADRGVALAHLTGYASFHSLALVNRAEALLALGRLDEAHTDLRAGQAIEQRLHSMDVRYPLLRLGDLYRLRGNRSLALTAYSEALRLSEESGDRQSLVPTLAGMARVLAEDDPTRAAELAERAVAQGEGMERCGALVALAVVRLSAGDVAAAGELVAQAQEEAIRRRERPTMAQVLEIEAQLAPDRLAALALLDEARGIWEELGSPVGALRSLLAAGRRSGDTEGDLLAEHAEQELRGLGAHGAIASVPAGRAAARSVEILSLGGFRVLREGQVVPVTEWQSRKARDLLKLLVARRGRPAPREALMEALWPDEDPDRLGNRLSVALSTIRGVLDPEKQHPNDHYVRTQRDAVALDLSHVGVDVEDFVASAERGLALIRQGREEEGLALLEAIEPRYRGDFLEEDLYEEWATSLREEARALYVAVLRKLAQAAAERGDHDGAVRRQLRLLERDPYDEPAHLALITTLVRSGRHGEARRHYAAYTARMDELGLEAAHFPA